MPSYAAIAPSALDKKAADILGDHVVLKSLAQQNAFQGLPRYVSEYLIAKFVRPESWEQDLKKVQERIRELLPTLERRELTKEQLLRTGELLVIDAIEARVDLRNGQRWARIPA